MFGYSIEELRAAARQQAGSAEAATAVADLLRPVTVDATVLGGVPSAAAFCATVLAARDTQERSARRESERRTDLEGRAVTTADTGQRLIDLTTAQAESGRPGVVPFGDGTAILGGG